jgi:tetratricopeptide (TPR) repeat protein
MPAETYMVVDPRRDHSFRVPRPDLTVSIGTPNACAGCHRDRTAAWAADAVAARHGTARRRTPHYGLAIHAGREAAPGAARGLATVALDASQPAIVRATAVDLVSRFPGAISLETLRGSLRDPDALVRHSALRALEGLPPEGLAALLPPLLSDPSRAVRVEAARVLAPVASRLDATAGSAFRVAVAEFESVQRESLDRPESHLNLGNLALARGDVAEAEKAYRRALAIDPGFVPGYVNLADLERQRGQDAAGERLLRDGLRARPGAPALHEALAMALVRQGRKLDALAEFAAADRAAPDASRYAWLHALALADAGRRAEAIRVLERAAARRGDRDVLLALATFRSEAGDEPGATAALRALQAVNPDDPALVPVRERLR